MSAPEAAGELFPSPRWVRVVFGGAVIADSKRILVLRQGYRLTYLFPAEDVRQDLLRENGEGSVDARRGIERRYTPTVGRREAPKAAWMHPQPVAPELAPLAGRFAFDWEAMDAWFEEDERVHVHPRDPLVRVDCLPSSRRVKIVRDGETLAESRRPVLVFETGLTTRYYLPELDVDVARLVASERRTRCPYKGEARYYGVKVGERLHPDLVWWYPYPTTACAAIAGLLSFYQERVELWLDGERQERPVSPR